jgi:hypothetical protein
MLAGMRVSYPDDRRPGEATERADGLTCGDHRLTTAT